MIEETDRFNAESDSGTSYTIRLMQHYKNFAPIAGPASKVPTAKKYITTCGLHVNKIDTETFQIVETDEIVRKA